MCNMSKSVSVSGDTAHKMWLRGFSVTISEELGASRKTIRRDLTDTASTVEFWQHANQDNTFIVDEEDFNQNIAIDELITICAELDETLTKGTCRTLFVRDDIQSYSEDYIQGYEDYPFCYAKPYIWQSELRFCDNIERIIMEENLLFLIVWITALSKVVTLESKHHDLSELQKKVKIVSGKVHAYSLKYGQKKLQGLLYTIEQYGEVLRYRAVKHNIAVLVQKALAEQPYTALMGCGDRLDIAEYAEIQQSSEFVCELEFNFDKDQLKVYRVKGNVPEIDRNDSNCVFGTFTFEELKGMFPDTVESDESEPCSFFDYIDSGVPVSYNVDNLIKCCEYELKTRNLESGDVDKGYCHATKIFMGLARQLKNELYELEGEKITLNSFVDVVQSQMKRGMSNAKRSQFDLGYSSAMSDCLEYLRRMQREIVLGQDSSQKTAVF